MQPATKVTVLWWRLEASMDPYGVHQAAMRSDVNDAWSDESHNREDKQVEIWEHHEKVVARVEFSEYYKFIYCGYGQLRLFTRVDLSQPISSTGISAPVLPSTDAVLCMCALITKGLTIRSTTRKSFAPSA